MSRPDRTPNGRQFRRRPVPAPDRRWPRRVNGGQAMNARADSATQDGRSFPTHAGQVRMFRPFKGARLCFNPSRL